MMLICTERLHPESPGSRVPVIFLLQASAGLSCVGIDSAGVVVAPEALPGSSQCEEGGSGQEGGARVSFTLLYFSGNSAGQKQWLIKI